MTDTQAAELAARLREITADLDGYISRRAAELAEPLIAEARLHAAGQIGLARQEATRQTDLVAELRRRIPPLDRYRDKYLRLAETARRVLRTYQSFLDSDDLDALRDALTDLQEAANA